MDWVLEVLLFSLSFTLGAVTGLITSLAIAYKTIWDLYLKEGE